MGAPGTRNKIFSNGYFLMKGNAWLVGFGVLAVVLVGGAGFFLFTGLGAYDEAYNGWDRLSGRIERYEKEVPYPNQENEDDLKGLVEDYEGKVTKLYESLSRYQQPLNTQISDSDFTTQVLPAKVTELLKIADEGGVVIDSPDEFYLAMGEYRATFPRPPLVPMLEYQLGAIDHLSRALVDAGVEQINLVAREALPGEGDASTPDATGIAEGQVVQKYPINLRFQASHAAFQSFINAVANDESYFFVVRLLRVENSSPEGPSLATGSGAGSGPSFLNADGVEAPQELIDATSSTTATMDELITAMAEQGYQIQREDARIIFGKETLDVFAVIDLVRFLSPEEAAAAAEEEEDDKRGANRRSR